MTAASGIPFACAAARTSRHDVRIDPYDRPGGPQCPNHLPGGSSSGRVARRRGAGPARPDPVTPPPVRSAGRPHRRAVYHHRHPVTSRTARVPTGSTTRLPTAARVPRGHHPATSHRRPPRDHRPDTSRGRHPATSRDHRPATSRDHHPAISRDHHPGTSRDHRPGTRATATRTSGGYPPPPGYAATARTAARLRSTARPARRATDRPVRRYPPPGAYPPPPAAPRQAVLRRLQGVDRRLGRARRSRC